MKTIALATIAVIGGAGLAATDKEQAQPTNTEVQAIPLVGNWTSIITMGRPGPTRVTTVTINEDGTYHSLDIDVSPGETDLKNPNSYLPDGADLRHSSGWIDLKTGQEKISEADRALSVESVTWIVEDGELRWDMDMGDMGGQGMTYSRVR